MKSTMALSLTMAALSASSVGAFSASAPATARRRTEVRPSGRRTQLSAADDSDEFISDRRKDILRLPLLMPLAALGNRPLAADAVTMKASTGVFKVGATLTQEEAEDRLRQGRESVRYLLDHYDEVCEGGGDNVRRYLGTVGTTSGLFGVSKVMKALMDRADDIVEYTELMNEIEACIQQADGSSYMAIFVTTSTSQDRPEKYFKEALVEIKRLAKNIDALAEMVQVDLKG